MENVEEYRTLESLVEEIQACVKSLTKRGVKPQGLRIDSRLMTEEMKSQLLAECERLGLKVSIE